MQTACTEEIKEWLRDNLTAEKYVHSLGTADAAREIAKICGYDEEKAYFTGLLHDCAKNLGYEEQLKLCDAVELEVGEKENKKVLHAPAGSVLAKKLFGVEDEEILSAIRWHTLGRIGMTDLEKIIFLADKIEPETRGRDEYQRRITNLNIDKEIFECYAYTIKSLVDRRLAICSQTVDIYNNLLKSYTNS